MSSCAACAVPDAPPSADRRHPHVQLRCCSAYRRAGSPRADTTTASARRAASTSFLDRAADLVDARRSCRRAPRAPSRTHRRAPTDVILTFSFVAALPIAAPAHRADTTTASARRAASTSFLDRAVDLVDARRSCRRAPRAPSRTHRRAPTDVILTFSFVAALPIAAPAHLEPPRRRRARAEPRARRSLIAPPTSSTRADRVVVRRVRRPGRTAGRRPTSSSRSASLLLCLSPRRLTRADTTTASARRAASTSFLDRAVDLVDARRSCRRAPRAPSRTHRRAPTDAILTLSFVAALPIAAPAHSSRHDDGERAPSREHVVP